MSLLKDRHKDDIMSIRPCELVERYYTLYQKIQQNVDPLPGFGAIGAYVGDRA